MKTYPTTDNRNIAIVGHASAGKTMLSESMLACSGVINRLGSIAAGTTTSDYHTEEKDRKISSQDHVILLEGIHGLNPDLVPTVPQECIYRIYVSALTQLNIDHHNRVPTSDTRLLRRIVRDARDRGHTARDTIKRWDKVRDGENRKIFPYQENADAMFNSALVYEQAALKLLAEPLLRQIRPGTPEYSEAERLLAALEWFLPAPIEVIPENSILREFIGGSSLKDFKLWEAKGQ